MFTLRLISATKTFGDQVQKAILRHQACAMTDQNDQKFECLWRQPRGRPRNDSSRSAGSSVKSPIRRLHCRGSIAVIQGISKDFRCPVHSAILGMTGGKVNGTCTPNRVLRLALPGAAAWSSRHLALAASEDEVRATFERFVAAQNAHDEKVLAGDCSTAPTFFRSQWRTVWGHDQAMKRFPGCFRPRGSSRRSHPAQGDDDGDGVAQLFVPIAFTMEAPVGLRRRRRLSTRSSAKQPKVGRFQRLPIPVPKQ